MSDGLRVCVLYPDRLDLYADRGNLLVLQDRCGRRGIEVEVLTSGLDDPLPAGAHLYYLGGGQDRDQQRCARDLAGKAARLRAAVAEGAFVLGICGGLQLLGHHYDTGDGRIEGLGLLDLHTEAGPDRLVGNAAVEVDLGDGRRLLSGFENHRGRTQLGPAGEALGRVVAGHGNNGRDGTEGARAGRVLGTYLHGPLFARNAWLADWLVSEALGRSLGPLEDGLERAVHEHGLRLAGC